ncbi:MAG: hypothetical protein IPJ82_15400 [Lewinellaceae bacterium]|nr:hypothetical protein [Lewinellaceae bacterium]
MKHYFFRCLLGSLLLLAGSCKRYYYVPNTMLIPAVNKQHDAAISGGLNTEFNGYNIQAFYSPVKHGLLTFNEMKIPGDPDDSDLRYRGKGRISEFGAGFYFGNYPFTISLLGGTGGGYAEHFYGSEGVVKVRLGFRQSYIQPGFALQTRGFRFGCALKQVWLNYDKGAIDIGLIKGDALDEIQEIDRRNPFQFTEAQISLGFRVRPVTFSVNRVVIFSNRFRVLPFDNATVNFSITVDLYEFWRWKDVPPKKKKPSPSRKTTRKD